MYIPAIWFLNTLHFKCSLFGIRHHCEGEVAFLTFICSLFPSFNRGKCTVALLNETESVLSYLDKEVIHNYTCFLFFPFVFGFLKKWLYCTLSSSPFLFVFVVFK